MKTDSEMNNWQPIETAPKDGSAVLGYVPILGYFARQDIVPICWSGWGGGVWDNATSGAHLTVQPSHWQSLPDPPTTLEK